MADMMALEPTEFAYRYMRRSGRLRHDDVRALDARLAEAVERAHPEAMR
jgi:hypothetical protein